MINGLVYVLFIYEILFYQLKYTARFYLPLRFVIIYHVKMQMFFFLPTPNLISGTLQYSGSRVVI